MTIHLLKRRRPSAPDPNACRCAIKHPVTAAEREALRDAVVLALLAGDADQVDYLNSRLTGPCRTSALAPKCPCGCGRTPSEHTEPLQEVA